MSLSFLSTQTWHFSIAGVLYAGDEFCLRYFTFRSVNGAYFITISPCPFQLAKKEGDANEVLAGETDALL